MEKKKIRVTIKNDTLWIDSAHPPPSPVLPQEKYKDGCQRLWWDSLRTSITQMFKIPKFCANRPIGSLVPHLCWFSEWSWRRGRSLTDWCLTHTFLVLEFFYKLDDIGNRANIGIRGFTTWKKNPVTKCYPKRLLKPWTCDSKSNTHLSELIWRVLVRRSLNFYSCTTWFLDLDGLVKINRAWLFKEPKVSLSQANAKLAQKEECWTWNQRFRCSRLTGGNILLLDFLFLHSKASYANNGNFGSFEKPLLTAHFVVGVLLIGGQIDSVSVLKY